eukprot:TRINITY_DN4232_c0_g1_i2.p1 TRINITY_DN4232_c0_g1~~TRINITY_DN4232_c0_g1_i2.p1  ORF type:complete len:772 (+),score=288.67 TRINITY_DN4232_c0_g1_i2:93-2408(+)
MLWRVSNTTPLIEDTPRIMEALSGKVREKGDKTSPVELFSYALWRSMNGERPVGEPLDLLKSKTELEIESNAILWCDLPPKKEAVPKGAPMKPPTKPSSKPPPKPDASPKPDTATKPGAGPEAKDGEGVDAKPKPKKVLKKKIVKKKKPEEEGDASLPKDGTTPEPVKAAAPAATPAVAAATPAVAAAAPAVAAAAPAVAAATPPSAAAVTAPGVAAPQQGAMAQGAMNPMMMNPMMMNPMMSMGMGMVPQPVPAATPLATGPPPAYVPKTPAEEIPFMMQRLMEAEREMEALQKASYQEDDSFRRRRELLRDEESVRRARDENQALLDREHLRQREDALNARERALQQQIRDMQFREKQELSRREEDIRRSAASPPRPPPGAGVSGNGWSPESILSVANLQAENRELRSKLSALRETISARREEEEHEAALAAAPEFRLEGKVKDALAACGLTRFERPLAVHGMDADAIVCATTSDLKELGLNENEARMLREALNPPPPLQLQPHLAPAAAGGLAPPPAVDAAAYPLGNQAMQVYALNGVPASPKVVLSSADTGFHKGVLSAFYTKYDAAKLPQVEYLLQELEGDVQGLYPALVDSYRLSVDPYYIARIAEHLPGTRQAAAAVLGALWKDREGELLSTLSQRACAWTEMTDAHGRVYYHSTAFGVSQWARPAAFLENDARMAAGAAYAQQVVQQTLNVRGGGVAAQGQQRTPSPSPQRRLGERDEHYRAWVVAYLIKNAPHRVAEVDTMLRKWSGPELVEILTREYPSEA